MNCGMSPDFENLHLNEIDSDGAGTLRMRFDGSLQPQSLTQLNLLLIGARIIASNFECSPYFPFTRETSLVQRNGRWRIKVLLDLGEIIVEASDIAWCRASHPTIKG